MTAETVSPREKVEPSLNELLRQAVETMKSWTPEQREAHFEAQKKAWVAAEMAFGDEGTRVVTSSASALASSGDHADHSGGFTDMIELARLADRLFTMSGRHQETYAAAATGLRALIAEVAALRARNECLERVSGAQGVRVMQQATRATEAGRKLAEAERVMDEIAESAQITRARHLARTFLSSKEAERG